MQKVINMDYYTLPETFGMAGITLRNTYELPKVQELITLIISSYSWDYAFWIDSEATEQQKTNGATKKVMKMQAWLDANARKISASLEAVETPTRGQANSTTRFNDTPQDGGNFEDDPHTTNFTAFTSNDAVGSDYVVSLNSRDLLNRYREEFAKRFIIAEANLT